MRQDTPICACGQVKDASSHKSRAAVHATTQGSLVLLCHALKV